ncbi:MAG TPA: MFS transporter [Candidatus Elarobacter sp.]|jgi:sugar phosphate permease|nr:MFS transporter [Candidatus Elarobacter sp.]
MARSIIAPAERVTNLRWGIAVLLGIGVLINYFDRVNLTVAGPSLRSEFGIDDVGFGFLLSGFAWTYAILQIPVGVFLDRYGVVAIGRATTLLWSIASLLTAAAFGFASIFGARLLLGVAETPTFPINSKATGYWFPTKERGLATAIFDSAAKLATGIGVPFVAIILANYGWRMTFVVTAVLSFLFFIAFWIFYRNPSQDKRLTTAERNYIVEGGAQPEGLTTAGNVGAAFGYLLRQRKVWGLTIGFAAYGYSFYLLLTWLPGYLVKTYHMDIIKSGAYAMVPWIVAAIADLLVGGWLVDYLVKRGYEQTRVRKTIIVIGMLMGLTIIGAALTTDPNVAIFWITVALTGLACTAPIGWSIPSLIAPRGSVGTIGGIMNFFNNAMAIAAPIVTGYIVAGTSSFANAFITAAAVLLVGIVFYVWVLGSIEPIPEPGVAA